MRYLHLKLDFLRFREHLKSMKVAYLWSFSKNITKDNSPFDICFFFVCAWTPFHFFPEKSKIFVYFFLFISLVKIKVTLRWRHWEWSIEKIYLYNIHLVFQEKMYSRTNGKEPDKKKWSFWIHRGWNNTHNNLHSQWITNKNMWEIKYAWQNKKKRRKKNQWLHTLTSWLETMIRLMRKERK